MIATAQAAKAHESVLDVENLQTYFYTRRGPVRAVDGVSFSLRRAETIAVVGESGCGKSVTALSVMRLVGYPGRIVGGSVRLDGVDLLSLERAALRNIRGNHISMIFQVPMTSLNPVMTIGRQIGEAFILHQGMSRKTALQKAVEMLQLVGIPEPEQRIREYPRRDAPARYDRHGPGLQSEGADCRRAHLGARRHHPSANPRSHR
jgi:peptide/nickel transport system ATP-binding protein